MTPTPCPHCGGTHTARGTLARLRGCRFTLKLQRDQARVELAGLLAENERLRAACKSVIACYESHQMYDKLPIGLIRSLVASRPDPEQPRS